MKKNSKQKFNTILNSILAIILIALGINILIIQKSIGAVSWWLLYPFALIGAIILVIITIMLIVDIIKKRRVKFSKIITLVLCAVIAIPNFWLFGLFQIAYPASIKKASPFISIRSPFNEEVIIGWGGDELKYNYPHSLVPCEKWAYDILKLPANTGSSKLEDYGIYNKDVVAPISGTVVAAYDKEADIAPNTEEFKTQAGNYVYIKIDKTGTYLLMNHFKQGTLLVKEGDHVDEGTLIGKVGNSGSTSEPHLHIHHQKQDPSKTSMFLAEPLPLYFRDIDGPTFPKGGLRMEDGVKYLSGNTIAPK